MNYQNMRIGIIAVLLAGIGLAGCSQTPATSGTASVPPQTASGTVTIPPQTGSVTATIPPQVGDSGTWELANPGQVTSESTSIDILITRSACASGKTGEILEPVVSMGVDDIIIRTDVVPKNNNEVNTCPDNDYVAATVILPEPIGNRSLLDATCLIGEESRYSYCEDPGPVRWAP